MKSSWRRRYVRSAGSGHHRVVILYNWVTYSALNRSGVPAVRRPYKKRPSLVEPTTFTRRPGKKPRRLRSVGGLFSARTLRSVEILNRGWIDGRRQHTRDRPDRTTRATRTSSANSVALILQTRREPETLPRLAGRHCRPEMSFHRQHMATYSCCREVSNAC